MDTEDYFHNLQKSHFDKYHKNIEIPHQEILHASFISQDKYLVLVKNEEVQNSNDIESYRLVIDTSTEPPKKNKKKEGYQPSINLIVEESKSSGDISETNQIIQRKEVWIEELVQMRGEMVEEEKKANEFDLDTILTASQVRC